LQSISFDRAAGYYDETRGLPEKISAQIAASAASLLPAGACVLEIGIGTGRISIPLLRRGLHVCGVDLSMLMMKRLVEKLTDQADLPDLIQANAVHLPLPPASFDAVFAVHVFHLINGWQQAATELDAYLRTLGAKISSLEAAQWETLSSPAETIQKLEAGFYSSTWHLSPEELHSCAASLRAWAREQYGELEQPVKTVMHFTWKLAHWPV
jgi:ubiquinone/menaquinone biosynthesis C-methylase UbiE